MSIVKSKATDLAPWYNYLAHELQPEYSYFTMEPVDSETYCTIREESVVNLQEAVAAGAMSKRRSTKVLEQYPTREEIVQVIAPCGENQFYRKADVVAFAKAILEAEGWTFQE